MKTKYNNYKKDQHFWKEKRICEQKMIGLYNYCIEFLGKNCKKIKNNNK